MRLHNENMPSFQEIKEFSEQLGKLTDKEIIKEKADSRVVLLGKPGIETNVRKLYHLDE